jgi:hypothetical protein
VKVAATVMARPLLMFESMLRLALMVPVVFALSGGSAVSVEGSTPVPLGKKGTAYPVKCSAPITFTASGPASLILDVRGRADDMSKPVELDITRNDKFVSKNALTLRKSKEKKYAGIGRVVLSVPEGPQQYALACDASADIAMSFQLTKKSVKTNPAAVEVAVEAPKPAEPAKVADTKPAEPAKPAPAPSGTAYVGLFSPPTTTF